ncbi:hypothetical protein [Bacillus thuringiensis]|uniref:Uncharacterized protein n=1 Tax=Bacillus thuringiensis HD-771 TaxID=1218175 RepID=A0A9W3JPD9_BACTU|nr:hypothetical protein [Bacillus thuringiensis]AFQ20021.1 hypothetical protein BTG_33458 [Bacillus thuringiensis HD-771]MEC3460787.1 hypothetical protein [Bacillus thuringiensis]MEC3514447.1 hypothetical protein [Bacillus thuringiensis]MEC3540161.1 hypothetical protein [Bacillus thuringiensis]
MEQIKRTQGEIAGEALKKMLVKVGSEHFRESLFKYLGALCMHFNINMDEVGRDIEKVIISSGIDDEMVMCDFRIIITKMFYKRKDDASYSQVKADIYDVMRKLSKPEKASFAHKLVGGHCYCVLLYLMEEYEKEMLALE